MSHESFVDFYSNYLETPAGLAVVAQVEGITDKDVYCAKMVEAGAAAGYEFNARDVRTVMEASEADAAKALAMAEGDAELADDALDAVVGGSGMIARVPVVRFGSVLGGISPGKLAGVETYMCPW